jgi:hypothetical protein
MDIAAALDAVAAAEPAGDVAEGADTPPEAANDTAGELEQALDVAAEPANDTEAAEEPAEADPFAPEQLATPGGIEKARNLIAEERQKHFRKARELDGRDIRMKEKTRKLEARIAETNRNFAQERNFIQDVYNTVNLVRTGNASQRIEALGRLTGLPGQKAYEELSFGIIHDGKKQAPSPEVAALETKIDGLYGVIDKLVRGGEQTQIEAEKQRQREFIAEKQAALIEQGKDQASYPNLSQFLASGREQEVRDYLTEIKREHHSQTGTVLDDGDALGRIERELIHALGERAAKPTSLGPPQKPSGYQAQRTPGHKAIPPSLAARSGGAVRELTEDERLDELSRDPEFMNMFGR